jgi:hypothetical protein
MVQEPPTPTLMEMIGSNSGIKNDLRSTPPGPQEQLLIKEQQLQEAKDKLTYSKEWVHRAQWKASVMATFNVALHVIAARLILLVAVSGAISLAWAASYATAPMAWVIPAVYSVLVVVPLVWLAGRQQ